MIEQEKPDVLAPDLRTSWLRYIDALVPERPALFGYCRRLTGTVWDAEDLVQDTLTRAFAQWAGTESGIAHPRTYLLRTATNVWIDWQRRRQTEGRKSEQVAAETSLRSTSASTASDVRDASARLLQRLSPQEQAALVLKEGFDMTLEEIARILSTTTGAVKAALHRGRGRLAEPEGGLSSRRPDAKPDVVDLFIDRLYAEDVDGLLALMLESSSAENLGAGYLVGLDPEQGVPLFVDKVVNGHKEWPEGFNFEHERRFERLVYDGEEIVAFFISRDGREALTNVMRLEEVDGKIARILSYGFCPGTIREIADALGTLAWTGIYRPPNPVASEGSPSATHSDPR